MVLICWRGNVHVMDSPLLMNWRCQVPKFGHSLRVHHVIFDHNGEQCQSFKHQLDIIFIKLGTLCHHQIHKYLEIQAMNHLVYDLWILQLFGGIFLKMGCVK